MSIQQNIFNQKLQRCAITLDKSQNGTALAAAMKDADGLLRTGIAAQAAKIEARRTMSGPARAAELSKLLAQLNALKGVLDSNPGVPQMEMAIGRYLRDFA